MDITLAYEALILGSNPGKRTMNGQEFTYALNQLEADIRKDMDEFIAFLEASRFEETRKDITDFLSYKRSLLKRYRCDQDILL